MSRPEKRLRISEYKDIIRAIQINHNIDLSGYAQTSLKMRMEGYMMMSSIHSAQKLIERIETYRDFIDDFLFEISVPPTELFRDGEAWKALKNNAFNKLSKLSNISIWMPDETTGEELFTLLIVLKEAEILEKSEIFVTSQTQRHGKYMQTGTLTARKLEISNSNYQRYGGNSDFYNYYSQEKKRANIDVSLLKKVSFKKQDVTLYDDIIGNFDLIVFRNRMIYYNKELQNKVLSQVYNSLNKNGFLFIGVKENIENWEFKDRLKQVHKHERIYRKQK